MGKIKKGAEHDTEVSQLPEPCSIASSPISFFLCHPDDLISNGFWNESCVLPYFMGSSSVLGIDNSTKKPRMGLVPGRVKRLHCYCSEKLYKIVTEEASSDRRQRWLERKALVSKEPP